jgi:hypothetical protein
VFSGSSPAKIRPGRPIYGPEALVRNIEYVQRWDSLEIKPASRIDRQLISIDVGPAHK